MILFKNKIHSLRKFWAYSMIKVIGIKINIIGKIDTTADIIVLNHNSMLDVIILDYIYPKEIAWMAKAKLAKTPIFGYIFKLPNLILIDKKYKKSIMIKQVKKTLTNNGTIGIFPEGTRGDTNDMKEFKKGAKNISEKFNLSIQPLILVNTRNLLDTKKGKASSGEIKLICLKKITPNEKHWYQNLEYNMKTTYINYSN